jgi:hypothetical protein
VPGQFTDGIEKILSFKNFRQKKNKGINKPSPGYGFYLSS